MNTHRFANLLRDSKERTLRRVLGIRFDEMRSDRAKTFELLKNGSAEERYGALTLLERFWNIPSDILVPLCDEIIASNGSTADVKAKALAIIGSSYKGSFDKIRSRDLAQFALDADQPRDVRASAIFALQKINEEEPGPFENNDEGSPERIVEKLLKRGRNLREVLELSVDWDWVRSFLFPTCRAN